MSTATMDRGLKEKAEAAMGKASELSSGTPQLEKLINAAKPFVIAAAKALDVAGARTAWVHRRMHGVRGHMHGSALACPGKPVGSGVEEGCDGDGEGGEPPPL